MKISTQIKQKITLGAVILLALIISTNWVLHTPAGCQAKAFAVGASVCHQIPSHSFQNTGVQFPLCARCTGLYLGSMIGMIYYFLQGKKTKFPAKPLLVFLLFLFLAWAGDGANSLITALFGKTLVYETTNLTRLMTGFGMGLVMSTILMTLFNMTIWKEGINDPLLENWRQIGYYAAAAIFAGFTLLNSNAIFFQIFAYISIGTVIIIISMLYAIFWIILFKKENTFLSWSALGIFLVAGFTSAMVQITLLYILRQTLLA
jgi:uncharacterized membrane protein